VFAEEVSPQRVYVLKVAPAPKESNRGDGLSWEFPTNFFKKPVSFFEIMQLAGGHHVGPLVSATSTFWNHVIDGIGMVPAIRAAVPIASQHASPRKWGLTCPEGNSDVVTQFNDRGHRRLTVW
jgi:hypothetical protein